MIKCKLSIRGFTVCEKDICCFCCSDLEVCRIRCSRDTPKGCNNKLEDKEEPNKNYEYVNNPSHYGGSDNVYEAIKVIEAWELNFNIGTAIRYLCRQGKKPSNSSLQDLKKAKWYIEREIKKKESEGKKV